MAYRPQEVAERLGIASSTLRLWSSHFARELSNFARKTAMVGSGAIAQRRYTEEDVATLQKIKALLGQGLTYEEVKGRLRNQPTREQRAARPTKCPTAALADGSSTQLAAITEALAGREKTIAALKESLQFMDAYLQAVRQEREDSRERARQLEKERDRLRARAEELALQANRPWWRQLLGLP